MATTAKDVILDRLIRNGISPETYEYMFKTKSISADLANDVTNLMQKNGVVPAAGAGLDKPMFGQLLRLIPKLEKYGLASLPVEEFVKPENIKKIFDNKLINIKTAELMLDTAFRAFTTGDGKRGIDPFKTFRTSNPQLNIRKGGERTIYTTIANDIYPVIHKYMDKFTAGSVDRLTALLLVKKGLRSQEFLKLSLDDFDNVDNPTIENSKIAKMYVKQGKGKAKLIHFSNFEASIIARLRQLARLNGTKTLMPNFANIDTDLINHIKNTYKGAANSMFRIFSEATGEFTDDLSKMTRTFIRNLFKDRIGSLLATDKAGTGTKLDIALNILNGEDFGQGVSGTSAKKYNSVPVQQMVSNEAFNITDDIFIAAMGANSGESLLDRHGVLAAYNRSGKIVIPELPAPTRLTKIVPAENMLMMDTYAMGWMDDVTKEAWIQGHSFKDNLMSSTAKINQLDNMTMSYVDNAAAQAAVNAAENYQKAAKITAASVKEIDSANAELEKLADKRRITKAFDKTATSSQRAVEVLDSRSSTSRTDADIQEKANNIGHNKPKRMPGESVKAWKNRINVLKSEVVDLFEAGGRTIKDVSGSVLEDARHTNDIMKAFLKSTPAGLALAYGLGGAGKAGKLVLDSSLKAFRLLYGNTASEIQTTFSLEQLDNIYRASNPYQIALEVDEKKRLDEKRTEAAQQTTLIEEDFDTYSDEVADKSLKGITIINERDRKKAVERLDNQMFEIGLP